MKTFKQSESITKTSWNKGKKYKLGTSQERRERRNKEREEFYNRLNYHLENSY